MVFALHSKVVQNLAAVVEFVHSIIKTLNCRDLTLLGVDIQLKHMLYTGLFLIHLDFFVK